MNDKKILFFSSKFCWPCKMVEPVIDKLISEWIEIQKIDVVKNDWLELAKQYSLFETPTIVFDNKWDFKTVSWIQAEADIRKYVEQFQWEN